MKIIFFIRTNPLNSHRPAEAIRIAAGLGTGKNSVKIIFSGESPRVMSPDEEDLVDIDIIEKFLPILKEWDIPMYVDKGSLAHIELKNSEYSFRTINAEETSEILAGGHNVFVF
ncbi:MAG: DsrE family protein [Nitrospirae bacterium]|nr:DsrE family protein [Nitrospirota bacterium]